MNTPQIYILIAVITLAVIASALILTKKKAQKPLSKMAAFAFLFIIAGIVFGDNRLMGYGLMGIGVIFAVIDIVRKLKVHGQK